jgi:hypothetical protein
MAMNRSTSTALVIAAVVLGGLGIYSNLSRPSEATKPTGGATSAPAEKGIEIPGASGQKRVVKKLRISPEKLKLGTISPCKPFETPEVVLTNDGDEPVSITGWIATCACVSPSLKAGETIEPHGFLRVPIVVQPLGLGGKSQRLDFRLDGNAVGGSLRIDYVIESPIRAMPVLVTRPEVKAPKIIDLERVDGEGNLIADKFAVRGFEPPVAQFVESLRDGHASFAIEYEKIDQLAEAEPGRRNSGFVWEERGGKQHWKTLELVVSTDSDACSALRIIVRNR